MRVCTDKNDENEKRKQNLHIPYGQGVYWTLKTLKALKTLNLENLTLKTLRTLKKLGFS